MRSQPPSHGVLTCLLARHAREAIALGRSLRLNSPLTPAVCVVEGELSASSERRLRECYDDIIPLAPEHHRMGWLVKHVMVDYSPYERTLFLDSDCLVLRELRPVFDIFGDRDVAFAAKPKPVQESGRSLYAGISLAGLMKHFQTEWWPQISGGGHFYFRRTEAARAIFARARHWGQPEVIAPFGWTNRSKVAPDEITLQMALVEMGCERAGAVTTLPLVCWTPWQDGRPDVFAQKILLRDRASRRRHWDGRHFVAHFGGDAHNPAYLREQWRLGVWQTRPGRARLTSPTLAQVAKPVFHLAAEAARKSRHGWWRAQRTLQRVGGALVPSLAGRVDK